MVIDEKRPQTDSHHSMREALEQTVSSRDFSSAAMLSLAEHMANRSDTVSYDLVRNLLDTVEAENFGTETDFRLETNDVTLAEDRKSDGEESNLESEDGIGRYKVLGHLGTGASGQVFEVLDNNFDRRIAVKFLHPQAAERPDRMFDFVNEAKLSAQLEHPNILPIHDVNISDSGMLYFSMQKAAGRTLKELLDDCEFDGFLGREIRDINDRVSIMIKVCDAIAYAHSKTIIHQDIKPSNIMIGQYGEVVLVDWGTATYVSEVKSGRGELVGTPIYMSPEQARREAPSYGCDIYCLGSTLFHILLTRFPTWHSDIDQFWELKKTGSLNRITRAERNSVPGPLLSIALKAMQPKPEDRYKSVNEMLQDLKAFQQGQKVSAHRDTLADKWRRLYRHNKRAVWVSAVGIAFIIAISAVLYVELLKSQSEWKLFKTINFDNTDIAAVQKDWQALHHRRFNRDTLTEHPIVGNSSWKIHNGALQYTDVGLREELINFTYKNPIPGDIRIEFDFRSNKDNQVMRPYIAGPDRFQAYHIHASSVDGKTSYYISRGTKRSEDKEKEINWQVGALAEKELNYGMMADTTYHFRLERRGNNIKLYVNNEKVFDVHDIDVLTGPGFQQFGFELPGGGSVIEIDNIVVYNRPLAQKVSPLTVADSYFRLGDFKQAFEYYKTLVDAYPGTNVRAHSLYRIGRCYVEFGDSDNAVLAYKKLLDEFPNHELKDYVLYEIGRSYALKREISEAKSWFKKIKANAHETVRQLTLIAIMNYYITPYDDLSHGNPVLIKEPKKVFENPEMIAYLQQVEREWDYWSDALQVKLFTSHPIWMSMPYMYLRLGQFDHVIARYNGAPRHYPANDAFALKGEGIRILEKYGDNRNVLKWTLLRYKKYDEYLKEFGDTENNLSAYWKNTKQYDKLREHFSDNDGMMAGIALSEGDYQKIIDEYPHITEIYMKALMGLGRYNEVTLEKFSTYEREVSLAMVLAGKEEEIFKTKYETKREHIQATAHLLLKALKSNNQDEIELQKQSLVDRRFDYWRTITEAVSIHKFVLPHFVNYLKDKDVDTFNKNIASITDHPIRKQLIYLKVVQDCLSNDTPSIPVELEDNKIAFEFLKGMRQEILGNKGKALDIYQNLVDTVKPHSRNVLYGYVVWRLDELK